MTEDTLEDPLTPVDLAGIRAPLTVPGIWGAATSRGRVRESNEDSWGQSEGSFFVVADGMGGYSGGALAARTAVDFLTSRVEDRPIPDWESLGLRLNRHVRTTTRNAGHRRAGTAFAALSLDHGIATICHVGDVRAYRRHNDRLHSLTEDHTVAAEAGVASGEDVMVNGRRVPPHALTRFIGGADDRCRPAISTIVPRPGDRLLLLTDGVFRQIGPLLLSSLAEYPDPQQTADALVRAADDAGGNDNATALVVDCLPRTTDDHHT